MKGIRLGCHGHVEAGRSWLGQLLPALGWADKARRPWQPQTRNPKDLRLGGLGPRGTLSWR